MDFIRINLLRACPICPTPGEQKAHPLPSEIFPVSPQGHCLMGKLRKIFLESGMLVSFLAQLPGPSLRGGLEEIPSVPSELTGPSAHLSTPCCVPLWSRAHSEPGEPTVCRKTDKQMDMTPCHLGSPSPSLKPLFPALGPPAAPSPILLCLALSGPKQSLILTPAAAAY